MKPWEKYVLALLLMLVWLLPLTASAEERKDEWKQAGYSFAPVKLVYVETFFGEKVQADDLKQRVLVDKVRRTILADLHLQRAGISFLTQDELAKKLSAVNGEDVSALAQSNPARYSQLLKEGAAFYCQAILEVRFSSYYDTVRHIPEHIETYETTKRVHINKTVTATNGTNVTIDEWIDVPVNEARLVEAKDEFTSHTGVELTLLDSKTGQPVWKLLDSRDAVEKDKDGMIDRTLKRAADRLESVKKS